MKIKKNLLKSNLLSGKIQFGCWLSLGNNVSAEICASAGFDWNLIDLEHSALDLSQVHQQLQVIAGHNCSGVIRVDSISEVLVKKILDLGAQSLLFPNVKSREELEEIVKYVTYPPRGTRGVSSNTRANLYGRITDYFENVDKEFCLMVQVETMAGIEKIEEISKIPKLDVIFIGPQDLAADLGYLGNPGHPSVRKIMKEAISLIIKNKKIPGVLAFDLSEASNWMKLGVKFIAVTSDQYLLARETANLVNSVKTIIKETS